MTIGPTLPPHLAKRSREDDDDRSSSPDASEKRRRVMGPAPPPAKQSSPRVAGPSMPPQSRSRSSSEDRDVGPAPPPTSKPARVMGPAPPPANLDERPPHPPSDDDSDSSDDDFGPAPPPAGVTYDSYDTNEPPPKSAFNTEPQYVEESKTVKRDDWMTLPPTSGDLSRIDPSRMRARKFNNGKGPSGGGGAEGMGVWTETPEQKLKRLQDEAMGITAPANSSAPTKKDSRRSRQEEENARRVREKLAASQGKSLVEQHKENTGTKEDDPSKRVFDYEKDMGMTNINSQARKEMLNKAKGFGDRFSSGSFL